MTITDEMVEQAAKMLCYLNGVPECNSSHPDCGPPCTPETCEHGMRDFGKDARAVLEAALPAAAPHVPEGWQLVPRQLTEEMEDVAAHIADGPSVTYQEHWGAMLAAAPSPPLPAAGREAVLEEALEQALDDMRDGRCVCQETKELMQAALASKPAPAGEP